MRAFHADTPRCQFNHHINDTTIFLIALFSAVQELKTGEGGSILHWLLELLLLHWKKNGLGCTFPTEEYHTLLHVL